MKPVWNSARRELWFGDRLIKRFRQPSANQESVLAAFQEEGWPEKVDDPLPFLPDSAAKKRLRDTVHSLNARHVTKDILRFEMDGTGQGVLWGLADQLRQSFGGNSRLQSPETTHNSVSDNTTCNPPLTKDNP